MLAKSNDALRLEKKLRTNNFTMASPASPPRPLPKLEPKPGLTFTFLSHEPKEGDPPSCAWENFKYPKLRKFPKAPSTLQFKAFLGAGTDSIVFQAKVGDDQEVAVKFVCTSELFPAPPFLPFRLEDPPR